MKNFFGIDFGTTNTAVVCIQDFQNNRTTRILGEDGNYPFSSIVAIHKDRPYELNFGKHVKDNYNSYSQSHYVFKSMKSFLGTNDSIKIGVYDHSPIEITTKFFKYIKSKIKDQYKLDIDETVLSFPVDFTPQARKNLKKAVEGADIRVVGLINEPTAAFIKNRKLCKAYKNVIVLDWGGGTMDISILELKNNCIYEKSVSGVNSGGDKIDRLFAERIHSKISQISGLTEVLNFDGMSPSERDLLINHCEEAKIFMSSDIDSGMYPFTIHNYGIFHTRNFDIDTKLFDAIVENIIITDILPVIEESLKKANLRIELIDAALIIGGSSNLNAYKTIISDYFKESMIIAPADCQWSAAEGSALSQYIIGNYKLSDNLCLLLSNDYSFNIFTKHNDGIGTKIDNLSFSLTNDDQNANFIFTNGAGNHIYNTLTIPVKGFYKEALLFSAEITNDQIASINVTNGNYPNKKFTCEITKLPFYYKIDE